MKKTLAIILAVLMIVPALLVPSFAQEKTSVTGTIDGRTYYYEDSYFAQDASIYNPSLSTMSYWMTVASNGCSSNNWSAPHAAVFYYLEQLGFVNPGANEDYQKKPETDTMGAACAYKKITVGGKTYTLLAIIPRSGNYESEWASNFTLGTTGDAAGFSNSAKKVVDFANEYVAKYGSQFEGELKVWITGYSRGAAVANLTAGRITSAGQIGGKTVAKENIYAYTFETPRGLSTETVSVEQAKTFTNIHNIISANDLVTKVAPLNFGFIRYGIDESIIPESRTAENTAFFDAANAFLPEYLSAYNADGKRIFASETFQAKKISLTGDSLVVDSDKSMGAFLDDLVKALCVGVGSRNTYYEKAEDFIRLMMDEFMGDGQQIDALPVAKNLFVAKLKANAGEITKLAITAQESALVELLTKISDEVIAESGLNKEVLKDLPTQIAGLVPLLINVALADVAIDGGADIVTFIENIDILFSPHYPDQCVAWLMALDPKYGAKIEVEQVGVTDVKVNITKRTTTKKVLRTNIKVTDYVVDIVPVANADVQKVEYRTLRIGKLKTGTSFSQDLKPTYLYISVTDKNGNVTHWEYKNSKVKQVE